MTSAFVFLYLLQESELDLLGKEDNDTDIEQYIITCAVIPQLLLSLNVVDAWECLQVEINATRRGKEWILG